MNPITVIESDQAPGHSGPVPQAVRAGSLLFVSAVFGTDPATDQVPAERADEARLLLANLERIVAAAGADLTRVVRVGIFMKDLQADRPTFNQVWTEVFGAHRPARSAVGVTDFGRPGVPVRYMIDAIADVG
ncbi:MAG: RidA family protein [Actinomycetales bacterium]